jgi:hypothetical protein
LGEPADLLQALTPGAVTVAAGVEGEALITTTVFTTLQVPSEGWGSAVQDVADDLALLSVYGMVLEVRLPVGAQDVCQL